MAAIPTRIVHFSGVNQTGREIRIPERSFAVIKEDGKITPRELKAIISTKFGFSEEHIRLHHTRYFYTVIGIMPYLRDEIRDNSELPDTIIQETGTPTTIRTFIEFSFEKCNNRQHCHT